MGTTTLNLRASTVGTASGSTWSTTSNAVDGAYGSTPATYATFTSLVSGAVGYIECGFGAQLANIPANATGISVVIYIRHLETNTTNIASVSVQLYDGATTIGSLLTASKTTSAHNDSWGGLAPTLAQLKSANLKVRVTATRAANTAAGNFQLDHVDMQVTYTVPDLPKLQTLTDTFDTTIDKTTKWIWASTETVWEAGRAKIPVLSAYPALSTDGVGTFDLTGSYVYMRVYPPPGTTGGSRETTLNVIRGGTTDEKYMMLVTGVDPSITAMKKIGAATTEGPWALYDPVAHAYFRIRESAGTVYFDTSPDAVTWTNFWSTTNGMAVTSVWVSLSAGYWGTETASDAFVDNVNTVPTTSGRPKAYVAGSFQKKPGKVYMGAGPGFVEKPWKQWTGSIWKALT